MLVKKESWCPMVGSMMSVISALNDNPTFMLKSDAQSRKNIDYIMGKSSNNTGTHSYKSFRTLSYK